MGYSYLVCRKQLRGVPSVDPSTLCGISPYVTRLPQVLLQCSFRSEKVKSTISWLKKSCREDYNIGMITCPPTHLTRRVKRDMYCTYVQRSSKFGFHSFRMHIHRVIMLVHVACALPKLQPRGLSIINATIGCNLGAEQSFEGGMVLCLT